MDNYYFLYLDRLHCPPSLMGLALTINTVIEVPVFLFSDVILGRLGVPRVYHLIMGGYAVRMCWYR